MREGLTIEVSLCTPPSFKSSTLENPFKDLKISQNHKHTITHKLKKKKKEKEKWSTVRWVENDQDLTVRPRKSEADLAMMVENSLKLMTPSPLASASRIISESSLYVKG